MNNNFNDEISLSPFFQLWDRGDGIGEIYLFNAIIGYIHGEQQLDDGYYYDEELGDYVLSEDHEYQLVSCFPGHLSSSHELLKPFSNSPIDCLDHLISLVQSVPDSLLPPKPKGSVIDVFSGHEKFLISRNFDFEIVVHGATIADSIIQHFSDFSHYLQKFLENYPEVHIEFLNHSYLNGNVYFLYELQNKYLLHLVFNQNNQMIFGAINQSAQMKSIVILECSEKNYEFICQSILEKLNISSEQAKFNIQINTEYITRLPKRKNVFLSDVIQSHFDSFVSLLNNQGSFILERDLKMINSKNLQFTISRQELLFLKTKIKSFGLDLIPCMSLFINHLLKNETNIS